MIKISTQRKGKKRLLLEKILDVEREIIPDRNHDDINSLTCKS